MKRSIALFGLLGLVGCFLPLAYGLSLFDLRHFSQGWSVYLMIGAFALPTIVGASRTETSGAAAAAGLVSFGYLAYKFGVDIFDLLLHTSIGGIMMGVAIIGGLASSLMALNTKR